MTEKPVFTRTREQVEASDPKHSVWVLANAGSGKTYVLVDRVVRLMLDGNAPDSILCLTFTKAAAAEMSLRLYGLLSSWIALSDEALHHALASLGVQGITAHDLSRARQLFALAIETPGGLKIQTIHAFCEKLLQLFPVEAGLAPGFQVMDETDRLALMREATDKALAEAAAAGDESMLLLEDGGILNRDAFEALAHRLISATSRFRDVLSGEFDAAATDLALRRASGILDFGTTSDVEQAILSLDRTKYVDAAEKLASVPPHRHRHMGEVFRSIARAPDFERLSQVLLDLLFTDKGAATTETLFSTKTVSAYPDICAWFGEERPRLVSLLESHAFSRKVDATLALMSIMRRVDQNLRAMKAAQGLYDFDDLIMRTAALLESSPAAQWVLYKLDGNLSHILVDEAQDTSPAQWAIIRSLADEFFVGQGRDRKEPRTVFVVGDIKQSIYSFQGADTTAFQDAQRHFQKKLAGKESKFRDVKLRVSYRSLPAILEMVDVVFAKNTLASAGLGPEADDTLHEAYRRDEGRGTVELWPLVKPLEDEERDHWRAPVDRLPDTAPRKRLARHLAATIKSWIGKRQLVSKNRPVMAGDILILLQSRNELFDSLIAELRQRDVDVAGADRLKLRENLAVLDLMALLQFCILPDDDLSLACVMKSPLMPHPLSEAELTGVAAGRKASLWTSVQEHLAGTENLAWLQDCKEKSIHLGPHAFLTHVLSRFRRNMLARLGEEALDASNTLLDVALDFEREHSTSIAAFLHWFMAREEDVKRELETGGGQLRIMTVHGAKGLESNIVILPDAADLPGSKAGPPLLTLTLGGNATISLPFFNLETGVKPEAIKTWKDEEKAKALAEKKRLLYVAMTRAKDELYIAGAAGKKSKGEAVKDSWYDLIEDALKKAPAGQDPQYVETGHPEGAVRRWGDNPVAGSAAKDPQGRQNINLPPWLFQQVKSAQAPDLWVSPSDLGAGSGQLFDRAAAERGHAIHEVLESSNATTPRDVFLQRATRRGLESATADALFALLQRPDVSAYFSPASRTESAIAGHIEGLPPIHGRVDRILIESDRMWLLDYKSGRKPLETPLHVLRQMAAYCAVLAAAYPDHAINAALLWTQGGELDVLDVRQLSRVLDEMRAEHSRKAT